MDLVPHIDSKFDEDQISTKMSPKNKQIAGVQLVTITKGYVYGELMLVDKVQPDQR